MTTLDSIDRQCMVCGMPLERLPGLVGRASKHCPKCCPPKPKSTRDTSSPQVAENSQLLCRGW